MCFVTTATVWVKPIVKMGLDVTDKLLCLFAMALENDPPIPSIYITGNRVGVLCEVGGSLIKDNLKTLYTFFKLVVFVFIKVVNIVWCGGPIKRIRYGC